MSKTLRMQAVALTELELRVLLYATILHDGLTPEQEAAAYSAREKMESQLEILEKEKQ